MTTSLFRSRVTCEGMRESMETLIHYLKVHFFPYVSYPSCSVCMMVKVLGNNATSVFGVDFSEVYSVPPGETPSAINRCFFGFSVYCSRPSSILHFFCFSINLP
jgi:hypothetical protein